MYFGLAFSRVGLDFRALMVPIFERAILNQFECALKQANAKFDESLQRVNWSELVADSHHSISANSRSESSSLLASSTAKSSSNLIVNPPLAVMDFHPLAVYLNVLLHSFNELRLCAPLSLHSSILGKFQQLISKFQVIVGPILKKLTNCVENLLIIF